MIIHRDGRTNIYWGDCFKEIEDVKKNFKPTVGLLNPPYKTKASDIEEFEFILNNLDALEPGGTCIAIIPISCVIEKTTSASKHISENSIGFCLICHNYALILSLRPSISA